MKKRYLSVATIVALSMSCAIAQENITKLDEITVTTSSMNEVLLKDTPANIEVVTAEQIRNMGVSQVKDVLKRVAGLTIEAGGGNSIVSIRGGRFDDVLYLLNGRKLSGTFGFKGKHQRSQWITENIDINSIERIEILKGSASVLYGSEASDGVINVITKKGQETSFTAGIRAGNYQSSNYYNLDFGQMGNWDAIANINLIKKHSVRTDYNESFSGAYYDSPDGDTINGMFDVGYKFNEDNELRLFSSATRVDEHYEKNDVYKNNLSLYRNYQKETRISNALTYNGYVQDHFFTATASYDRFIVADIDSDTGEQTDNYSYNIFNADARDTWSINDNLNITFGGSFTQTKVDDSRILEVWEQQGISSVDEHAFFIQGEIALFDKKFFIVPALRYDKYSTFGSEVTSSIGATYHINDNNRFKINYGEAFEAPDTGQLYGTFATSAHLGNPNLKPEESESLELRYELDYNKLSASVAYFDNDYKNLITTEGTRLIDSVYVNVDKARNKGFEIELSYDFTDSLSASTSYVHSNYEEYDSHTHTWNRMEWSPKDVVNAEVSYYSSAWDLSASAYGQFVFDKLTPENAAGIEFNEPVDVNYNTFGVNVRKTWYGKYSLTLSADNIFNDTNANNETYKDETAYYATFEVKF